MGTRSKETDIIDLDLSVIKRKKFRIDGDDSRILELNTSDMNIVKRLDEVYPKLNALAQKVSSTIPEDFTGEDEQSLDLTVHALAEAVSDIDTQMREQMDYLFDAPVSKICAPFGNMYDPIDGELRFEHIIEKLSGLYEQNMNSEYKKMKKRIDKYTSKIKK